MSGRLGCPSGELLPYHYTNVENGMTLRRYWSTAGCNACNIKSQCTISKERRVTRWEHEETVERVQKRLDANPDAMRTRRETVEHPFGTLKARMGATHFLMKRLPNVAAEMALHVLAYNLTRVMNIPFLALPMTIMSSPFVWTGLHRSWRASTPGVVAKQLIENPVANPLIFVDEFDKTSEFRNDESIYNAFYPLLEPSTAKSFVDEYLMAPIDASHISWIFTANNLSKIPAAILDRLNVVHVKAPTLDHRRRVLHSIYLEANDKFASLFDHAPSADLLAALNAGSLRTARRDLEAAMARAAGAGRATVLPAALPNAKRGAPFGIV
jgi:hypothetical protein